MAVSRLTPNNQRTPAMRGQVIRYFSNGQWIIRRWPKKRGKPKSLKVQNQNNWFGGMRKLLKRAPAMEVINAMQVAHGTGKYPGDVMMAAAAGNLYRFEMEDGTTLDKWEPQVYPAVYAGFSLKLNADFTPPINVWTPVPWDQATIDTSGFWDIATPTIVTIPTGINLMDFTVCCALISSTAFVGGVRVRSGGGISHVQAQQNAARPMRGGWPTGPIPVAAGLQFSMEIFTSISQPLKSFPEVKFAGTVLDAL